MSMSMERAISPYQPSTILKAIKVDHNCNYTWNFVTAIMAFFHIDLMGTAFLDEVRQFRSVDGNFGPHIHAPQRVISIMSF